MTTPTIDRWAFLDPARMRKQINAAHTGAVGPYALLDPGLLEREVNALSTQSPKPFLVLRGLTDPFWTPGGTRSLAAHIGSI